MPGPALGGVFQEEARPFPGGEVGLGGAEDEGVALTADRGGRSGRRGLRPRWRGGRPTGFATRPGGPRAGSTRGSRSLGAEPADRGEGLAERQGGGFQAAGPRGRRAGHDVGGGADQDLVGVDLDPLAGDLGGAGSLQRGKGERGLTVTPARSAGRATRSWRPSSVAAPMTRTSARGAAVTQGTRPSIRNRPPGSSSARTAWAPWRRDVVSCDRPTVAKAAPCGDLLQPAGGDGPVEAHRQAADPGVVLREDERRRHRPFGHPGIAREQGGAVERLAAELGRERPAVRPGRDQGLPERLGPGPRPIGRAIKVARVATRGSRSRWPGPKSSRASFIAGLSPCQGMIRSRQ